MAMTTKYNNSNSVKTGTSFGGPYPTSMGHGSQTQSPTRPNLKSLFTAHHGRLEGAENTGAELNVAWRAHPEQSEKQVFGLLSACGVHSFCVEVEFSDGAGSTPTLNLRKLFDMVVGLSAGDLSGGRVL